MSAMTKLGFLGEGALFQMARRYYTPWAVFWRVCPPSLPPSPLPSWENINCQAGQGVSVPSFGWNRSPPLTCPARPDKICHQPKSHGGRNTGTYYPQAWHATAHWPGAR